MHEFISLLIGFLAQTTFPAVLFTIGATIHARDVVQELRRPRRLLEVLAASAVLAPLGTATVLKLLPVQPVLGGLMLLSGATGGSVFALLGIKGKKGNLPLGATAMALLSVLSPLTIPAWLWALNSWFGLHLAIAPLQIVVKLLPYAIPPLLLGVLFRTFLPRWTDLPQKVLGWFAHTAVLALVAVLLKPAIEDLFHFSLASLAAVFLVTTFTLFAGYYLIGGGVRPDKVCGAMTATQSNVSAWLLVVHLSYPQIQVWKTAVAYIVLRFIIIALWYQYHKALVRRQGGKL